MVKISTETPNTTAEST